MDLTSEERTLMSLIQQEVDALRIVSQIPIGTELYKFKMEQFKELSTTRAEIEKIVQEQRLQRSQKGLRGGATHQRPQEPARKVDSRHQDVHHQPEDSEGPRTE